MVIVISAGQLLPPPVNNKGLGSNYLAVAMHAAAQEENVSAEATMAARAKKAAKKAPRKERDAALGAVERQPPPAAASAALTAQHGPGASHVSTHITEPAAEAAKSGHASATAKQTAAAGAAASEDHSVEPETVAILESSVHVTMGDIGVRPSGAAEAAFPAAPAEARPLLPPGLDADVCAALTTLGGLRAQQAPRAPAWSRDMSAEAK